MNISQRETREASLTQERKPGRPRAIPERLIPKVLSLYRQGLGYRAVARELLGQEGLLVDWCTVRRIIKARTSEAAQKGMGDNDF